MVARSRIICADALAGLRELPDGEVALTVTSPPYYRHRDYGANGQIGREATVETYVERIASVLAELFRVTDARGSCFVVVGDTYRAKKLLLVPHRVALSAEAVGWTVRNDIIWEKLDPPPESTRDRWRMSHEHVLFLTKSPSRYRFKAEVLRVPYSPATLSRWGAGQTYGGAKSLGRRTEDDARVRHGRRFRLNPLGCLPTDVWSLPAANTTARHYATFPEPLIRPIIQACSEPGDVVLDPFVGSGTVCATAKALGRRWLGIELNPEFAAMARQAVREVALCK
jgi:DNA modification methylase